MTWREEADMAAVSDGAIKAMEVLALLKKRFPNLSLEEASELTGRILAIAWRPGDEPPEAA